MTLPLAGIRVLEVANYVAGPSAGALLCDLGAEVIKVEPPGGEVMRAVQTNSPINFLFELENRGKRSICVALDTEAGREAVAALLPHVDVLLTNLFASRLEKYGLAPEPALAANPRLVHVSITGYGIHGPDADRPAFDFAAFWARSGIMGLVGHPDTPPVLSRVAQGDHTTGINGLAATLAALRLRDLTGDGQVVEVSLQQTGAYTIATDLARVLYQGAGQPGRFDRTAAPNPLFNTYPTSDGEWLMVVHMTPDPYWPRFCRALGFEEWEADERFRTMAGRQGHAAMLCAAIEQAFQSRPYEYWARVLDEQGLIWAPMAQLEAVVADPQLRAMGAFREIRHPLGTFETVSTPFYLRDSEIGPRGPAAAAGADTTEVFEAAGIGTDQVAELARRGAFG